MGSKNLIGVLGMKEVGKFYFYKWTRYKYKFIWLWDGEKER